MAALIKESKVTVLTSGTSWTVPSDWNSQENEIMAIGGGGGGAGSFASTYSYPGSAGGGGSSAIISNITLTPGETISYSIGAGGSGGAIGANGTNGIDTIFNSGQLLAKGGERGYKIISANVAGGKGGQASESTGTLKFSGGNGANAIYQAGDLPHSGPGGGGAAGNLSSGLVGNVGIKLLNTSDYKAGGPGGNSGNARFAYSGDGGNGGGIDLYYASYEAGAVGGLYGGGGGGGYTGGNGRQGAIVIRYGVNNGLPSTGEISASDVNNLLLNYPGRNSEEVALSSPVIRTIFNKSSGQIAYTDGYGATTFIKFPYTINTSGTYYSGWGNGRSTPALNVASFLPAITTGQQFYIDFNGYGNWTLAGYQSHRVVLQYGTPISPYLTINGYPGNSKINVYLIYYNGSNNFYVYSYYSGSSTSFPNSESAIRRVQFLPKGGYSVNQLIRLDMSVGTYANSVYSNIYPQWI